MSFRNMIVALSVGSSLCVMSTSVIAQENESSGTLTEIVVTAQRQSQSLQDVPISVTTVTAADVARSGVTGVANLATVTPGLLITTSQRTPQIFIRGVGSQNTTPGDESSVSIYVDGVYKPSAYGNLFSFNNISRIEVLKGPQGTLFGRNATGGLIHVVTREPTPEFVMEGSVNYGSFDTAEGSIYLSGGAGNFATDVAVYGINQADGFGKNLITNEEIGRQKEWAVRSKSVWEPTADDKFTLIFDYGKNSSDLGLYRSPLPGVVVTGGRTNTGTIFDSLANPFSDDRKWESYGASLKYERDLGDVDLSILSAAGKQSASYSFDSDGTPLLIVQPTVSNSTKYYQNEILLSGETGKLNWITGVFVLYSKTNLHQITDSVNPINATITTANQDTDSYAGFLDLTYDLSERTKFTLGARYTRDSRAFTANVVARPGYVANGVPQPAGTLIFTTDQDISWGRVSWRAVVDHQVADDFLVYASYNRGFKSGVYNLSVPTQPVVNPEDINAYEIGLKSELFDRSVRFNASIFHYDYSNIQLQRVVSGGVLLFNAAKGKVDGVDLDVQYAPRLAVGRLLLRGGLSLLNARYADFKDAPFTSRNPAGGNNSFTGDATGNKMTRSPEWTLNIGADYSAPVGAGELGLSASLYHNSGFYFESDNRLEQGAYDIVNAQLYYSFGSDQQYKLRVFGRNLTDARYYTSATEIGFGDQGVAGAPRTFGVGFDFRFR